ncbi:lytic murein transglycosylase [Roseobacter sp. GAI101]|uniref:lytic murein transglycosylase n=1 Tax=Roseobacter sp. (strain GAI101) TaxID=391589 RepID=UPI000187187F|nr:lytic murein transglycosylase [Roseobacter sp. GAI101]EEB84360.1 peptidoglycan binding domain protein [Roseobacter sp. GAI101]
MSISRRGFTIGLAALGLSACDSAGRGQVFASRSDGALPDDLRPQSNGAYDAWVAAFKPRARAQGISDSTLRRGFAGAGYLPGVVKRDRNQTEFSRTLEDYLAIAASEERVSKGRAAFARHRDTLRQIEARYGVAAEVVTAVWGLESFYGERRGNVPVISATSTLAFDGRRGAFFEKQLIAALKILERGDVSASGLTGSWAGAMGHTQFIPTSYQAFAVDFNGDGRRDIWSENPADSLASTAAYLAKSGWQSGQKWGGEMGTPAAGSATPVSVLQPDAGGPRFAVFRNFQAIKRYNNSDNYAIGVGHLSDRIAGGGPIQAKFGPDRYGLTIDDRKALQQRLTARGFDTDGTDGVIGPNSRKAIAAYQQSVGLSATGDPSRALLDRLS